MSANNPQQQGETSSMDSSGGHTSHGTDTESTSGSQEELQKPEVKGQKPTSTSGTSANESSSLIKKDDGTSDKKRLLVGIGLAILFSISMTLTIPCLQLLGPTTIGPLQLLFFAFLAHVVTVVPVWFACWGGLRKLEKQQVPWLLAAALANGLSTTCFYLSSESLPTGVVGAVGEGSLLVISVIITGILDRHVAKLMIVATVVCCLGLAFYFASTVYIDPVTILEPPGVNVSTDPLLLGTGNEVTFRNGLKQFHPSVSYIVLILSSLLMIAGNIIIHRRFGKVSFSKLLLFFPIVGLLVVTIALFSFSTPEWNLQMQDPDKYLPFIGFLFLFTVSSVSLYGSWMRTPAPIFGLISAGSIVLLVIIQYVVEVPGINAGHLDALEVTGALLILLANVIGPLSELELSPCQEWLENQSCLTKK